MDRRRYMGVKGGGKLPYDSMVTYLEGTGTQFILTDFAPNQDNVRCVFKAEKTVNVGDSMIFHVNTGSYLFHVNWYLETAYFRFRGVSKTLTANVGTHIFELGNTSKVDSTSTEMGGTTSLVGNTTCMTLFATATGRFFFKGRIYYVKAYYGDTLVLDLIPVRVGQVGYMYDRISGKLFGNSGSGDFLIGDDIVPIEYLEATDGARIRTNYVPTGVGIVINTKMCIKSYSSGTDNYWFGCGTSGAQYFRFYRAGNSNNRAIATYSNQNTNNITNIVVDFNNIYEISLYYDATNNNQCASVNGTVYTRARYGGQLDNVNPLNIFASSTSTTAYCNGKVYYFQVYNNGELVLDLIPVRIGTTGYMYNIVSSEWFANAGTGDFVLGADVNPPELPYDAEVYYLESTGTQYIDTGIVPDENTGIEIDIVSKYREEGVYLFGLREDNNDTRWCVGQSSSGFYVGYGTLLSGRYNSNSAIISFNFQNNKQFNIIKDSSITSQSENLPTLSFTPTKSIILFGNDYINEIRCAKCRVCSVKISQGSEVIMDLIPVRKGQVGYMYDKISGQMLGNDGTGAFVFGQDKSEDYVQEGLVFYLDGINKGGDNSAWLDLVRGAEFAYNEHSTANTDNVAMDGAGIISSDFMIGYDYRTSTIEIVYNVSNTDAGGVFYSGVDYGISFILAGAGFSYATGSGKSNNQYDITKPTGNVVVSMSFDNIVLNGATPTFTKSTNGWNVGSETSLGGRKYGNQYLKACTIYAIRIYNRKLSTTEMIANQRVDNQRFNLGLNI